MWQTIVTIIILAVVAFVIVRGIIRHARGKKCTNCDSCPYCTERKRNKEYKLKS